MQEPTTKAVQLGRTAQHACEAIFSSIKVKLNKKTPTSLINVEDSDVSEGSLTTNDIFKIIKEHRHQARIDYGDEHIFHIYDRRFFYRNLLKYIIISHEIQSHYPHFQKYTEVIDVGCGVGTFGLAWLTVKQSLLPVEERDSLSLGRLVLLDTSEYQIKVATKLLRSFFAPQQLEVATVSADLVRADVFKESNLALCGYVFSGLSFHTMHGLVGKTIVVDYEEKIDELYEMARSIRFPTNRKKYKYSGSDFVMDIKSVGLQVNCMISGPKPRKPHASKPFVMGKDELRHVDDRL